MAGRAVPDWRGYLRPVADRDLSIDELAEELLAELGRDDSASLWDYRSVLRVHLLPAFGGMTAREITPAVVEALRDALAAADYARSTVERCLTVLSRLLEIARARGAVELNAVRQVERANHGHGRVEDPQRRAREVLAWGDVTRLCCDARIPLDRRALWATLFLTGARPTEALGFRWSDLTPPEGEQLGELKISRQAHEKSGDLRKPKTKVLRRCPVAPDLYALLERYRSHVETSIGRPLEATDALLVRVEPPPFGRPAEGRWRGAAWRPQRARSWWYRDLDLLGLARRGLYSTRHTFVSRSLDLGVGLEVARSFTHVGRRRDAFFTYLHLSWAARCEAARKLVFDREVIAELERASGQLPLFA